MRLAVNRLAGNEIGRKKLSIDYAAHVTAFENKNCRSSKLHRLLHGLTSILSFMLKNISAEKRVPSPQHMLTIAAVKNSQEVKSCL